MKKKDIIIISTFANTGLIAILLFGSLNGKKEKKSDFLVSKEQKEEISEIKVPEIQKEDIFYKLPKIEVEEEGFFEFIVKQGDSLEKIAKLNNTTVDELVKINNLTNSFLKIGQVIFVPKNLKGGKIEKEESAETKKIEKSQKFYIVKSGDNPWIIAMKHHMKVEDLLKINNLDEEKARKLRPGDKLLIR